MSKKKRTEDRSAQPAEGKSPTYLPTSDPPKPRPLNLLVMAIIAAVWIAVLVYLAWQQVSVESA